MSWLKNLHATYENCFGKKIDGDAQLMPICHTKQNAQIEVTIDGDGKFRRAAVIETDNATLVPCTEGSAGRAGSKPTNHPLCDKLQYLAGDFLDYGGDVTSGFSKDPTKPFEQYLASLSAWCDSPHSNPKVKAIFAYVSKKTLARDLVGAKLIPLDSSGKEIKKWDGEKVDTPLIFKALPTNYSPLDAFVRWKVEIPGETLAAISEDKSVITSWIDYYCSLTQEVGGACFITGEPAVLSVQHPSKIRHAGDKAKLISGNDKTGYTFRGRFNEKDPNQAASVSFDVSQKAHNALRWLIERQGYRNGDLVYVAWSPEVKEIPDPFAGSDGLFGSVEQLDSPEDLDHDVGQHFASQLNKAISGYRSALNPNESIVILGVDSATPGRLSIVLQREITGSDFLNRIEKWHSEFAWPQNYSKKLKFVGAPSPVDIAEAVFGQRLDDKLKQATIQRVIPCIVDGSPFPADLVKTAINRMSQRMSMEPWEWNKFLGITCSIFRGFSLSQNKEYSMSLETDNTSRDYLFGRLLAIAEHIEARALFLADERRDTNAARQMQRFADFPFSTWKNLELAIGPYKSQLRSKRGAILRRLEKELDEVMSKFSSEDFKSDKRLSGEFLLSYHCQRRELWNAPKSEEDTESVSATR
jgi:CRISPR-associated protein Csd1